MFVKRSNRDFYDESDVQKLPDEYRDDFNYNGLSVNLFNINKSTNLELQDLDYKFISEIDRNPSRFKIYKSKERMKDFCLWPFILLCIFSLLALVLHFLAIPNCRSIVTTVFDKLEPEDVTITVQLFTYIGKQCIIGLQVLCLITLIISLLTFLIHKPFRSINDGKYKIVITDDVGFYLIECDKSEFHGTGLERLYFVKYACSELGVDLTNCVVSVSYYSSYSCSMRDSKTYVLDLPNDSVNFSNSYDFEFYKGDYSNKDFKSLCEYLDSTEDGEYEEE